MKLIDPEKLKKWIDKRAESVDKIEGRTLREEMFLLHSSTLLLDLRNAISEGALFVDAEFNVKD